MLYSTVAMLTSLSVACFSTQYTEARPYVSPSALPYPDREIKADGVTCFVKTADWSDATRSTISFIDDSFVRKFCRRTWAETIQRIFTGSCPTAAAMRLEIASIQVEEAARGRRIVKVTCAAS